MGARIPPAELAVILTFVAIPLALIVWPSIRIVRRLGLPTWLGILAAVPVANLIVLWVVAYSPWPRVRA